LQSARKLFLYLDILDYVNEVKNVLFTANNEKRAQALKKYVDRQPPPLNTQFGERLPKPVAIERQQQRKSNVTQFFPSGTLYQYKYYKYTLMPGTCSSAL
jgi:hypothetical protein